MAKYDITYACGHTGTVNVIGHHRSRESRLAYLESGECFDCYKQHVTVAAKEQANEMELPALVGSEKQVAWAETLRLQKLAEIEKIVDSLEGKKHYAQVLAVFECICNEVAAKQWIDWRYDTAEYILNSVGSAMMAKPTKEQKRKEIEDREHAESIKRAALTEATLRPADPISGTVAEISLNGNVISILFPEWRDDFREVVRRAGYTWSSGCWQRTIEKLTAGKPGERLVEIAHMLLARRFFVRVFDEALRAKIVSGEFEPEHTRWISRRTRPDGEHVFAFQWGRNEDYYHYAMKIEASRYISGHVCVPIAQFEKVAIFAQAYDFRLTPGAQESVCFAQADREQMPVVAGVSSVASTKPPVLTVPAEVEVASELRDE